MTEVNNYYVNAEAEVYSIIGKDAAKCIFKTEKDRKVYLILNDGETCAVNRKQEISSHDGRFGILVGTLQDFLHERKKLFPDLESVARYYNAHGVMPWGIKSIIKSKGWYNRKEAGYRYIIVNEAGNEVLKIRMDGGVELRMLNPIF